jgi:hypothetical protein
MTYAHGYIAIVSAIIVSAILTMIVLADNSDVLWARLDQLAEIRAINNETLANSCGFEALLMYAEDPQSIEVQQDISLSPNETCFMQSRSVGSTKEITSYTVSDHAYAGILITIKDNIPDTPFTIISWRDITSIPP